MHYKRQNAVVPGYYLVCYNSRPIISGIMEAVVPGYYLVCYNYDFIIELLAKL